MESKKYEQAMEELNGFLASLQGKQGRPSDSDLIKFSELEQAVYDGLRQDLEEKERQARLNRRYGSPYMSKWVMR